MNYAKLKKIAKTVMYSIICELFFIFNTDISEITKISTKIESVFERKNP